MAYNAVSQADLEVASNATDSDDSRSSSPHREGSFQQLAVDHDHMGGSTYLEPAKSAGDSGVGRLESMIRSMTSTSYDMVEEDDYEVADHPSTQRRSNSLRRAPPLDTTNTPNNTTTDSATAAHQTSPDTTLRTPVTDQPVPLSHPTPDLQSLQGAYLNNVERLERSAERMTSSPTDIGAQIRQIDRESKRRSVSSLSSPVATNNDAFAMKGGLSSPHDSILSASRLAQVSEHATEPQYYGHHADPFYPSSQIPSQQGQSNVPYHEDYHYVMENQFERPTSAASGDTYQQARILFTDFDGVHYANHDKGDLVRHVSITRPPLASRPEPYKEPQAGENMVYYPAPVPVMLNLPPKLSQKPHLDRERRRTQIMNSVSAENRKSAAWGSAHPPLDTSEPREKQFSDLPPQLRASAFFEPPPATLDIDVKQESAVATLESILDASTHAPVSAFTDHPFAGHLGSEVYGSSRPKSSTVNLSSQKKKQASRSTLHVDHRASDSDRADTPHQVHETEAEAADVHEGTSLQESSRDGDPEAPAQDDAGDDDQELPFTGPPTTLLAELELRKHELRQRQRTAATSVGLHSTLLQLDAVAQKQSEHRRQRPVTLAWEDPEAHKNDDGVDEDVPLGILFPEKGQATDESRPLGLMERREMEESEPLSRRRARLRGEPAPPPRTPDRRPNTMYMHHVPGPEQPDSGDEGETLAQRLKRLKGKDRSSTAAESEFTTELLAELSHLQGDEEKDKGDEVGAEEETLAQRRARLQKEAVEAKGNSTARIPRYRRSMADILHTRRPTTMGNQSAHETSMSQGGLAHLAHQRSYDARASVHQFAAPSGPPTTSMGFYQNPAGNQSSAYGLVHPNTFYSDAILGMNHLSYAPPPGYHAKMMRPEIDSGQREMIDRWRQSIV